MGKKKMLQFSPELNEVLHDHLISWDIPVETRKMFGHTAYFLNGYMFTGASVRGIYVHLGKDETGRALAEEKGVEPFEPREGSVLKDYLLLTDEIVSDRARLKEWIVRSAEYLHSLPPKEKKNKKKG